MLVKIRMIMTRSDMTGYNTSMLLTYRTYVAVIVFVIYTWLNRYVWKVRPPSPPFLTASVLGVQRLYGMIEPARSVSLRPPRSIIGEGPTKRKTRLHAKNRSPTNSRDMYFPKFGRDTLCVVRSETLSLSLVQYSEGQELGTYH
jgi:hypothetical protein